MFAAVINAFSVMVASLLGVAFKNRINEKYTASMLTGMAIVVGVIGVSYAIETEDVLSIIICMAIGTLCGEVLKIERHPENFGDKLKARFEKGSGQNSAFTQSFVAGSLLFCIGPMAILGSLQAGTVGDSVVTEMSAAGGILIFGIAINMLGLSKEKIRVGNMLPALFLPILYQPLSQWLSGLF